MNPLHLIKDEVKAIMSKDVPHEVKHGTIFTLFGDYKYPSTLATTSPF